MSKVKFSENLFLGVSELKKFQKFLEDDGYKRQFLLITDKFGLIRQTELPGIGEILVEDNFYVSKAGTPTDEVIVNVGVALDKNANLILNTVPQNFQIPNGNNWYWIKVSHQFTSVEKGTISLDSLGNVTGVSTEFLSALRGQPNFPSKIKFTNSTLGNSDEYEVVSVTDDDTLVLQGDFIPESGLTYSVIGTFTPGFVVSGGNKNIFQYDSCSIELVLEVLSNVPPGNLQGEEFYIARAKNNSGTVTLEDKRIEWWKNEASNALTTLDRVSENPLIGIENVKWDIPQATRDRNWVELAWGFRSSSWTLGTSSKTITLLAGQGGVFKDTSYFANGNFDNWRVYSKDGSYQNIVGSVTDGTYIAITLDVLNPEDYVPGDVLFICPPYEEIQVKTSGDSSDTPYPFANIEEINTFAINTPLARFRIAALAGTYNHNAVFRYKIFNDYSDWMKFPDDAVGFYKEVSFDDDGNLKPLEGDRVRNPYIGDLTVGFLTVVEAPRSFDNFQSYVDNGDLLGVNTTAFSAGLNLIQLQVTQDKKYQHFKGIDDTPITLTTDVFVNLKKFKDDDELVPCRESNTFILHISQFLNLDAFKIRIVQDFINSGSYTLVAELNKNDMNYIKNNSVVTRKGLYIVCTFNELGNWIATYDTDTVPAGSVRMQAEVPTNYFDANGDGQVPGFYGWSIMDEMLDKFPMGTNAPDLAGDVGGSNTKTLDIQNIPPHTHTMTFGGDDANDSGSSNTWLQAAGTLHTKTSGVTGGETNGRTRPIDITPAYHKFLFLIKT